MVNTLKIKTSRNVAEPAATAFAEAELGVKQVAAAYNTASSAKLYYGEDVAGDGTTLSRAFGFGIKSNEDNSQGGVNIGGNLIFTSSTGLNTTVSSSTITHTLRLDQLAHSTTNSHGDKFLVFDGSSTHRNLAKSSISLSGFNDDYGFYSWRPVTAGGNTLGSGETLAFDGQQDITISESGGTVSIFHSDTSSQSSVNNSGDTFIQDITLDGRGHVTALASAAPTPATTYGIEWVDSGSNAKLRLNPSSGSNDDLLIVAGDNITLTPSGDNLIIDASGGSGTVTSVTAGAGMTQTGTSTINPTLNVIAGTGIDVAADAISVDVSDFMTNGTNNYVVTATGADAMNAEANLTFDGGLLTITDTDSGDPQLKLVGEVSDYLRIIGNDEDLLGPSGAKRDYARFVVHENQSVCFEINGNEATDRFSIRTDPSNSGTLKEVFCVANNGELILQNAVGQASSIQDVFANGDFDNDTALSVVDSPTGTSKTFQLKYDGTITAGTWQGGVIGASYLSGQSGTNTGDTSISNSTSNTSSTTRASETAAKAAYDRGSTGVTNAATAQTTASAALPKTGGALTGNLTTDSLIDGRDVASDGALAASAVQPADTFYIGTTSVAHNRSSGALTLESLTLTTPTIASTGFANMNHTHAGSTTGGTIAISATTGTLAVNRGGTGTTSGYNESEWDTAYTHSQVSGGVHASGTVTSVGTNTGLSGTVTSSGSLSLALDNLADMTQTWVNGTDEFIVLDDGTQKKKLSSEIFGSNAFNSTSIPSGNAIIDWTASSAGTIHSTNYTNTTYSVGDGGLTQINFTSSDNSKLDGIESSATADQSASEIKTLLENGIDSVHYVNGSIDEEHLSATNSPTDNYLLSYDSSSSGFTWVVSPSGGGGGDEWGDAVDSHIKPASGNSGSYDLGDADQQFRNAHFDGTVETDALTIGGVTSVPFESADHSKLDGIASSANNYSHPSYSTTNIDTSTSTIIDSIATNSTGHITAMATRTLTLANLGYTGATDANNYSHPTSAGNKHVPTGGSSGQFLKYTSSGTAVWAADNNTQYSVGDGGLTTNNFTDADHSKLNAIEASATADQSKADINALDITEVGTISSGVWNGTAIANGYLANGSIDTAAMGNDSVDSAAYVDASIDTAHIANDQITNALMADDAVGVAQLSATGTASSSTFLRGDNAWAAPAGGGGGDEWGDVVDSDIIPASDNLYDIGSLQAEFKNAFFDGTVEADAYSVGGVTGIAGGTSAEDIDCVVGGMAFYVNMTPSNGIMTQFALRPNMSDIKYKENIADFTLGTDFIKSLPTPQTFDWKESSKELGHETAKKNLLGYVAQTLEVDHPKYVNTFDASDEEYDDFKQVNYAMLEKDIIYSLVNTVKELEARLATLEAA